MTCINQYMKEHPDATLSEVIKNYCPFEFYNIDEKFEGCTDEIWGDCERCWNREIPGTDVKKEKNIMTCMDKLIAEHPEWSKAVTMKCMQIFTPNEYFALDGQDLFWIDIYPGEGEKCSEDEDWKEKRELLDMIKDYEDRLKYANAEIDNLDGKIAGYKYEVKELIAKLDDANKCALDCMNELAEFKKEYETLDEESDRQDKEIEELRNKLAERARTIENQRILINGKNEVIENYQKMERSVKDLGCTITSDFVVVPPIAHITNTELELMDLKDRYEVLSNNYKSQEKGLDTQNEVINSLHDKVKLRDEEINKLVKENEELRKSVDILEDGIERREKETMDLHNEIGIHIRCYNELKNNIETMGFTVTKDNEVITTLHKPHIMSEIEYIERDLEVAKKVAEHYKSLVETSPIVITKSEESTIRPFNELPYVRYARHIHMKYKALVDNGFSHDDAMSLIPMWDDNEFEGFKHRERDE